MRSIRGWLLMVVAGFSFFLGWTMRAYSAVTWVIYVLGLLALALGISHLIRKRSE